MKKYKTIVKGKVVRFGAKGYRIAPGTKRGDSYCARSWGISQKFPSSREETSPNYQSRKKWRCRGKVSLRI